MAQKALFIISLYDISLTNATSCIGNFKREKPPPLSNSFIPYIIKNKVYRNCEKQHCSAEFIYSEKMRLRNEKSDAFNLKNKK